jgi:hypothetical protein
MKQLAKLSALALIGVAIMGLTGCIQVHSDTVIEKDGSGTANFNMSMSPAVLEAIKDMKELDMDQGQDMDIPMFEDINREDLDKAAEGHGVKITKFEKGTVEGREQLEVVIDFEDLEGLSYVMGNLMGGSPGDGMGIYETADGNFVLKEAQYDFPDQPAEEIEEIEVIDPEAETEGETSGGTSTLTDQEKAQKQMEVMGKMMGAMAELDVRFTITVPGEVIESNAPTVEGNTSIWAINAGNMMEEQGNDMEPVITFSSKGLKIKAMKE